VAYSALQSLGVPVESSEFFELTVQNGLPRNSQPAHRPIIRNTAMALAQILDVDNDLGMGSSDPIPLLGEGNALFLRNGLAAPLYTAYQLLASLPGRMHGSTAHSLECRSENQLTILLFNSDPRGILNVRLETKNLPEQFILMKKQIPEENNCYGILEALGQPDTLPAEVVREIDQSHLGVPHFQMVDKVISPVIDLMIYPQHVTLLVISPLTSRSLQWKG